jgi:predicted Fe-Mo cluster-binding NifX family protein
MEYIAIGKGTKMKIAITSTGSSLDSSVSERFGRCAYFVLYDDQTKNTKAIVNSAENADHGAGPRAAQLVVGEDAEVVITGAVGGNAGEVLKKAGIRIITGLQGGMKVAEAIDLYLAGKLK